MCGGGVRGWIDRYMDAVLSPSLTVERGGGRWKREIRHVDVLGFVRGERRGEVEGRGGVKRDHPPLGCPVGMRSRVIVSGENVRFAKNTMDLKRRTYSRPFSYSIPLSYFHSLFLLWSAFTRPFVTFPLIFPSLPRPLPLLGPSLSPSLPLYPRTFPFSFPPSLSSSWTSTKGAR